MKEQSITAIWLFLCRWLSFFFVSFCSNDDFNGKKLNKYLFPISKEYIFYQTIHVSNSGTKIIIFFFIGIEFMWCIPWQYLSCARPFWGTWANWRKIKTAHVLYTNVYRTYYRVIHDTRTPERRNIEFNSSTRRYIHLMCVTKTIRIWLSWRDLLNIFSDSFMPKTISIFHHSSSIQPIGSKLAARSSDAGRNISIIKIYFFAEFDALSIWWREYCACLQYFLLFF